MSTKLQHVTIQATIDTPDGRITFKAPYPLKYKRNIEIIEVFLVGEGPIEVGPLEYYQTDCAKALASETYNMFSQLHAFIDGKDCPMDGLQEEEDYDDARPSEQR